MSFLSINKLYSTFSLFVLLSLNLRHNCVGFSISQSHVNGMQSKFHFLSQRKHMVSSWTRLQGNAGVDKELSNKYSGFTFVRNDLGRKSEVHFFEPLVKFGKLESTSSKENPVLLYLPGLDGTGLGASRQFPTMAKEYDVYCFTFSPEEVIPFGEMVEKVLGAFREIRAAGRKVMVMGDSYGGLLSSTAVLDYEKELKKDGVEPQSFFEGVIMVNSATSYLYSKLYQIAEVIKPLPGPLYTIGSIYLTTLVFDWDQIKMIFSAIQKQSKEKKSLSEVLGVEPKYEAYFKNTLEFMTEQPSLQQSVFSWRVDEWLNNGCLLTNPRLCELETPCLVISGSSDSLLPSLDEAYRLEKEIPNCTVHIVEGAGHAGAMDSRLNLLEVISQWKMNM